MCCLHGSVGWWESRSAEGRLVEPATVIRCPVATRRSARRRGATTVPRRPARRRSCWRYAVGRREDAQAAHVGVVGGEQHADVAGDAGDDDAADLQIVEQRLERGVVEAGVLRLEDEVVARVGRIRLDTRRPGELAPCNGPRSAGSRIAIAEVVDDIDDGGGRRGATLGRVTRPSARLLDSGVGTGKARSLTPAPRRRRVEQGRHMIALRATAFPGPASSSFDTTGCS